MDDRTSRTCARLFCIFATLLLFCSAPSLLAQSALDDSLGVGPDDEDSTGSLPLSYEDLSIKDILAGSVWSWSNPYPQGNTLYSADIVVDTGLISVGDLGTSIVTTNRGASWQTQHYVGTSVNRISACTSSIRIPIPLIFAVGVLG